MTPLRDISLVNSAPRLLWIMVAGRTVRPAGGAPSLLAEPLQGFLGVVVPESGHLSTIEQPEAVNRALLDWLASSS